MAINNVPQWLFPGGWWISQLLGRVHGGVVTGGLGLDIRVIGRAAVIVSCFKKGITGRVAAGIRVLGC